MPATVEKNIVGLNVTDLTWLAYEKETTIHRIQRIILPMNESQFVHRFDGKNNFSDVKAGNVL